MSAPSFPDDLVHTQRAWNATYQALAACRPADNTRFRRRLLRLSLRLYWHPYLVSQPTARPALRATAETDTDGGRTRALSASVRTLRVDDPPVVGGA